MNKYENALIEILNGLSNYDLFPIEVKECVGYRTKYILYISTDFDEGINVEVSEETYNLLVQLDKDINGKEEE